MPTFIIVSLVIAAAAALTAAICAIDLWVRREAAKGKYIVREKPCTLCSTNIVQTLRAKKGWDK